MDHESDASRLHNTLDGLKRRLQHEREESETLTHHLTFNREQGPRVEDPRLRKLESELAAAQKQLAEQKAVAEQLLQQLAAEKGFSHLLLLSDDLDEIVAFIVSSCAA